MKWFWLGSTFFIVANLGFASKSFRQPGEDIACKVVEFPAVDVYYGTPRRKAGMKSLFSILR
jgi:hypothetical protein